MRTGAWCGRCMVLKVLVLLVSVAALASQAAGPWREAAAGYRFRFPQDHASHPEYKLEWWYYTGNVQAADGRRFGFQVTFFRVGIDAVPENPSRWSVRDLFMAHLAVSDPAGRRYRFDERLSRAGPGLSGASTDRYRVWNGRWSAGLDDQGRHVVRAESREAAVDLVLEEGREPVINGIDGISQKGAMAGNASHYYSLTRMPTRGAVTIDGERFEVTGESWMDHEFGTSFLEAEQQGWDWLSIQLDGGSELMLYQLRRSDGSRDPRSSGTLIARDGTRMHLTASDFTMERGARSLTGRSGAVYPVEWRLTIPRHELSLTISTPLDDQELWTSGSGVAYWEGMIEVAGTDRERPVSGRGYLEMTGYKGSLGRIMTTVTR